MADCTTRVPPNLSPSAYRAPDRGLSEEQHTMGTHHPSHMLTAGSGTACREDGVGAGPPAAPWDAPTGRGAGCAPQGTENPGGRCPGSFTPGREPACRLSIREGSVHPPKKKQTGTGDSNLGHGNKKASHGPKGRIRSWRANQLEGRMRASAWEDNGTGKRQVHLPCTAHRNSRREQ